MEPPAVTSCSVSHVSDLVGGNQHVNKREMPVEFLQVEPQLNFSNRPFEDLPDNFLETISPQQTGGHSTSISSLNIGGHHVVSPQLASLTGIGVSGNDASGYATLLSMPVSSHYVSSLKMEAIEHLNHSQLQNNLDKTPFGNGPAGLLSPLQLDGGNRDQSLGLISVHRSNGRTSEMLSGIRRPVSYIKEEIGANDMGFQSAQEYDSGFSFAQPTPQELERMNAETPPALSTNTEIMGSISDNSPTSPNQDGSNQHFVVHHMSQQHRMQHHMVQQQQRRPQQQHHHHQSQNRQNIITNNKSNSNKVKSDVNSLENNNKGLDFPSTSQNTSGSTQIQFGVGPMGPGAGVPRATYSTSDTTDPLNAEIDDDIYIDTKDLCKRVAYELKQHSIPQAIFAERILCRSQGTLSDLLRNPKPWNRLKSGRETFRRMFNWLQQPLHIRLSILDMYKGPMGTSAIAPPTPAQNVRHHTRTLTSNTDENGHPHPKRPRLVFTDIQKKTLQAIFKETQRPSREMQQTIAEHLRLDMSTVSNFFMNARRRSRNGSTNGTDEPAPYQQIRQITPPPDSSPQQRSYTSNTANSIVNDHGNGNLSNNTRARTTYKSMTFHSPTNYSHPSQNLSSGQLQQQNHASFNQERHEISSQDIKDNVNEVLDQNSAYTAQYNSNKNSPKVNADQNSSIAWNNENDDENLFNQLKQNESIFNNSETRNIALSRSKMITVKVEHQSRSPHLNDTPVSPNFNKKENNFKNSEKNVNDEKMLNHVIDLSYQKELEADENNANASTEIDTPTKENSSFKIGNSIQTTKKSFNDESR